MDKKYEISTLIKTNYKTDANDIFILGKIDGIAFMVCKKDKKFTVEHLKDNSGYIYKRYFTGIEYDDFINIVEELYPGLCDFDYKIN